MFEYFSIVSTDECLDSTKIEEGHGLYNSPGLPTFAPLFYYNYVVTYTHTFVCRGSKFRYIGAKQSLTHTGIFRDKALLYIMA
jgi:hypothetical protein